MIHMKSERTLWQAFEGGLHTILRICFNLFHRELSEDVFEDFMQFVRFCFVGLSNTAISYVLYASSLLTFRYFGVFQSSGYIIAQVIQFLLSVLWSFFWNNKLVFKTAKNDYGSLLKILAKTYISYAFTGLFLSSLLLVFWVRVMRISEFIAPIINLCVSVPLNFLINKFWAFKSE